jgi:diaminohydroxyphosphoribosylaminopyrimidine deaminase/5-amino-6-(5-phosphoribosylamino)uracil reductase
MDLALTLARRGLGTVAPNPSVGCVVVKNGRVVGRGWTQPGGRPHAETEALARAGVQAKGATLYVTLEPCCHHGKTPPCTDAIIAAGIAKVVGALQDPDPRVAGQGYRRLRDAGVEVVTDAKAEATAAAINAGFILKVTQNRPLFTLKAATSLDGRIATATGDSRWITGEAARAAGHLLRFQHDAIMVGSNTALADDPMLTVRLPGASETPKRPRIVVDGRLRLPPTSALALSADDTPLWIVTQIGHASANKAPLEEQGATIIEVPSLGEATGVDLLATARALADRGLTRILVEGGGRLSAALLKHDLVDGIAWFRAPSLVGGDGLPAIANLGLNKISERFEFSRESAFQWGQDSVDVLIRKR